MGSCGVVGLRVRDFPISHTHTDTGRNLDLQFIYPKTKLEIRGWLWLSERSRVAG